MASYRAPVLPDLYGTAHAVQAVQAQTECVFECVSCGLIMGCMQGKVTPVESLLGQTGLSYCREHSATAQHPHPPGCAL